MPKRTPRPAEAPEATATPAPPAADPASGAAPSPRKKVRATATPAPEVPAVAPAAPVAKRAATKKSGGAAPAAGGETVAPTTTRPPRPAPAAKAPKSPRTPAAPKAKPAPAARPERDSKPAAKVRKPAAPKAPRGVRGADGRFLRSKPPEPLLARDGRKVSVVHLAVELAPIARTGGLGEVVGSLAAYQAAAGLDVAIVMPLYRQIREQFPDLEPVDGPFTVDVAYRAHGAQLYRLPEATAAAVIGMAGAPTPAVYFIDNRDFFDRPGIYGDAGGAYQDAARRYAFFGAAAMRVLPRITDVPVILHAHDWHTALALAYLRTWYADSAWHADVSTVLTVHNAGYQGHFAAETMHDVGLPMSLFNYAQFEWYGRMNLLKGGMSFADAVTTVSMTHADELRTPDGGFGLHGHFAAMADRFVGILNGIDQSRWDPSADRDIPAMFSREDLGGKLACRRALQEAWGLRPVDDVPIFVMTARLVQQKGLDLLLDAPWIFEADAQWAFLGHGDPRFVHGLRQLAARHPGKVVVDTQFTDVGEHRLIAGGDVLLMPCQYEPCGLTQMRAQRYGTVPLVRRVGGLADTVHDGITGFVFDAYSAQAFAEAVSRAIVAYRDRDAWFRMMRDGMARDFGWERSEERYRDVYRTVLSAR